VSQKRRVSATVSPLLPRRGRPASFAYGYADLAQLFGYRNVGSVRNAIHRRLFDPSDLESVLAFAAQRRRGRKKNP